MDQYEVVAFCDKILEPNKFADYCPNGLQVEGKEGEIKKIALGVSVTEELIRSAMEFQADMILAHHGLIWDKQDRRVIGAMRKNLHLLLTSDIACVAYHLPLDFNPEIGNNVMLAKKFGLTDIRDFLTEENNPKSCIGSIGTLKETPISQFAQKVEESLGRKPLVVGFGPEKIKTVAITSGGGQGYFPEAIKTGADCFVTGEASEYNYAQSQESKTHFLSAGHYATEKFGVQELGKKIEEAFSIETRFFTTENPI